MYFFIIFCIWYSNTSPGHWFFHPPTTMSNSFLNIDIQFHDVCIYVTMFLCVYACMYVCVRVYMWCLTLPYPLIWPIHTSLVIFNFMKYAYSWWCVYVSYVRVCALMYVGVHTCIYVVVRYVCMCLLTCAGGHKCWYVVCSREWIICVCLDEDLIYRTSTYMLRYAGVDTCVVISVVFHVCLNAHVY